MSRCYPKLSQGQKNELAEWEAMLCEPGEGERLAFRLALQRQLDRFVALNLLLACCFALPVVAATRTGGSATSSCLACCRSCQRRWLRRCSRQQPLACERAARKAPREPKLHVEERVLGNDLPRPRLPRCLRQEQEFAACEYCEEGWFGTTRPRDALRRARSRPRPLTRATSCSRQRRTGWSPAKQFAATACQRLWHGQGRGAVCAADPGPCRRHEDALGSALPERPASIACFFAPATRAGAGPHCAAGRGRRLAGAAAGRAHARRQWDLVGRENLARFEDGLQATVVEQQEVTSLGYSLFAMWLSSSLELQLAAEVRALHELADVADQLQRQQATWNALRRAVRSFVFDEELGSPTAAAAPRRATGDRWLAASGSRPDATARQDSEEQNVASDSLGDGGLAALGEHHGETYS